VFVMLMRGVTNRFIAGNAWKLHPMKKNPVWHITEIADETPLHGDAGLTCRMRQDDFAQKLTLLQGRLRGINGRINPGYCSYRETKKPDREHKSKAACNNRKSGDTCEWIDVHCTEWVTVVQEADKDLIQHNDTHRNDRSEQLKPYCHDEIKDHFVQFESAVNVAEKMMLDNKIDRGDVYYVDYARCAMQILFSRGVVDPFFDPKEGPTSDKTSRVYETTTLQAWLQHQEKFKQLRCCANYMGHTYTELSVNRDQTEEAYVFRMLNIHHCLTNIVDNMKIEIKESGLGSDQKELDVLRFWESALQRFQNIPGDSCLGNFQQYSNLERFKMSYKIDKTIHAWNGNGDPWYITLFKNKELQTDAEKKAHEADCHSAGDAGALKQKKACILELNAKCATMSAMLARIGRTKADLNFMQLQYKIMKDKMTKADKRDFKTAIAPLKKTVDDFNADWRSIDPQSPGFGGFFNSASSSIDDSPETFVRTEDFDDHP